MTHPPQPDDPAAPQEGAAPEESPPPQQPRYALPPEYRYAPPPQYAPPPYAYQVPPGTRPGPGEPFDGAADAGQLHRPLYGANPAQALTRFFRNYVNFSGRASRSEFWWMVLIFWVVFLIVGITGGIASGLSEAASPYARSAGSDVISVVFGFITLVLLLGSIIPWISIGWRRLHDANLAGPLYLLNLVPYLGGLVVLVFTILPPRVEGRRFDRPIH